MSGRVERAIAALARGGMIIVSDDASRENEGDLVVAADAVVPEQIGFIVRHSTGILCAPMSDERADRLDLPPMVADSTDPHGTAFTVTVDHVATGTGVSATDRAATLRALADDRTQPADLRRPGHVFPLRARPGGVLERPGHTEAAVDLLRLAGRSEVGVIGEIVTDDGEMARDADLRALALEANLPIVSVAELNRYRARTERVVELVAVAELPTRFGALEATVYRSSDGTEHVALTLGDPAAAGRTARGALVRVHSECLTGDVLGSLRCDCGSQLHQALICIAAEGAGALVYLRGHEGRGIGLAHKIRAYALQDRGLDTVDANRALGLPDDSRHYDVAAAILADLGITRVRLVTNNPDKGLALCRDGITITEQVCMPSVVTPENLTYLTTKRDRMGHLLDLRSPVRTPVAGH
jgi:3,4-dihydroxy 2-butanone 4-phosphate synthase/GTP cyclohydrolase II